MMPVHFWVFVIHSTMKDKEPVSAGTLILDSDFDGDYKFE